MSVFIGVIMIEEGNIPGGSNGIYGRIIRGMPKARVSNNFQFVKNKKIFNKIYIINICSKIITFFKSRFNKLFKLN
jgi:hypothetical protein